jgi:two-component system C4-dicarboxylate transport response regulator DctD
MTGGRILLIDDEEEMRRSSAQALELFGLEVDTFSSAEPVLELVGYAFDGVVVSDIRSSGSAKWMRRYRSFS